MNTDKILDDAREKIAEKLFDRHSYDPYGDPIQYCSLSSYFKERWQNEADQILAISGTTDIECPECKGSKKLDRHFDHHYSNRCPKCNGHGVIKHKWKIEDFAKYGQVVE